VSPSQLARAELAALLAEVGDARRRLSELAQEIANTDPGSSGQPHRATLALLGVDLHSYYTTIEGLIERIVGALEGRTLEGPSTHIETIRHATRSLPQIRPAIFDAQRRESLDELRRFRHFFRHAYALSLRHAKLRRVLDLFPALHADLEADLSQFADFVQGLIDELSKH